MTGSARIEVADVSVFFPLYHGSSRSLKKTVLAAASGRLGQDKQSRVVVQALRDISFTLSSGDRLGLIGMNGAGKTTLLRTLAGIYEPVTGRVRVQGSLNAMLDPSLGMNVDLTGRENIHAARPVQRPAARELPRLEEDVAAFAGFGDFMDLPVRIYSVRHGGAAGLRPGHRDPAADPADGRMVPGRRRRVPGEGAGSAGGRWCAAPKSSCCRPTRCDVVRNWCTRVLWLDQGRIRADGAPDDVLARYLGHPVPQLERRTLKEVASCWFAC